MHWMMSGKRADTGRLRSSSAPSSATRNGKPRPECTHRRCPSSSTQDRQEQIRSGEGQLRTILETGSGGPAAAGESPLRASGREGGGAGRKGRTDVGDDLLEDDLLLAELLVALLSHATAEPSISLLELGPELLDLATGWRATQRRGEEAGSARRPPAAVRPLTYRDQASHALKNLASWPVLGPDMPPSDRGPREREIGGCA